MDRIHKTPSLDICSASLSKDSIYDTFFYHLCKPDYVFHAQYGKIHRVAVSKLDLLIPQMYFLGKSVYIRVDQWFESERVEIWTS